MKILFERSGGFAGLRIKADIDIESLPFEQAENIRRMLQEAGFFDLPAVVPALPHGADRFQYNLAIEDNGKHHSVEIHETETLPEPLKPLLKLLMEIARSHPRT